MRIRIYAAASKKYVDALRTKKEQWIAYYRDEYPDTTEEELFEMAAHKELNVDTESAGCSNPDDEKRIRATIKKSGGFHLLDKTIFKLRFKLAKELMVMPSSVGGAVGRLRQTPSSKCDPISSPDPTQPPLPHSTSTPLPPLSPRSAPTQAPLSPIRPAPPPPSAP